MSAPEDDPVAPPSHDWRLLRRLLGYLRPHRAAVGAAFALIVAQAGIDLAGPYLTKVAIDRHIAKGDAAGLAGVAGLYLLALAVKRGGRLATLDRRIDPSLVAGGAAAYWVVS